MSKCAMPLVLALGLFLPSLTSMCLPSGFRPPATMGETATASTDLAQAKATEVPTTTPGVETPTASIDLTQEKATEVPTTAPETETPTPTLESKETVVPPAGDCFADVPEYPGAKRDEEMEAELGSWIPLPLLGSSRIYSTADPLEEIIEFYEKEMPKRGWTLGLTPEEEGTIVWEQGDFIASFLIDRFEEESLILAMCYNPASLYDRFLVAAAPDVSKDGVEVTDFSIGGTAPTRVGDTLRMSFTLRNATDSEMNFSPNGVFVGCRDPDDENCDFAHKELTLKPGDSFTLKNATIEVDKPGTWHFWPGYYLGHWGPYKWQELRIEVE